MFPWASYFLCLNFLIHQMVETLVDLLHWVVVGTKIEYVAERMGGKLSLIYSYSNDCSASPVAHWKDNVSGMKPF